jgi:tetratricopeptide (TPR) repeat protein
MSENLGNTQPNIKVVKKSERGRRFLFNALGMIVLLALAVLGGYQSGLSVRRDTRASVINQQLGEQFQNALVDIQFGRYEIAQQRLEWIIANNSSFPGAQEKLTEVLVLRNVPTPTVTPSLTPTPDFTGAEQAYARAQQLIAAQDWPGAISAVDEMRKLDPNYQVGQVDGMYYFALRNYGYNLITREGNLEGGIYQITLAERFGPLDRDTNALREGARVYLIGASFWELNWKEAVFYFDQVYRGYAGLWDRTMTGSERFWFASMRYGDELIAQEDYCGAVTHYQNAEAIAALDAQAAEGYARAYRECFPATATLEPTLEISPTVGGDTAVPTDTQPAVPTETPAPSETPNN